MSPESDTTVYEHESLALHVEKCEIRYQSINSRLDRIELALNELQHSLSDGTSSTIKVLIGTAGTIIAGLLSTIVVLLITVGG